MGYFADTLFDQMIAREIEEQETYESIHSLTDQELQTAIKEHIEIGSGLTLAINSCAIELCHKQRLSVTDRKFLEWVFMQLPEP